MADNKPRAKQEAPKSRAGMVLVIGVVALAAASGVVFTRNALRPAPEAPAGCVMGGSDISIGGPIALIDQGGRAVTDADFRGSPSLVYFGFTYCPDICPLALQMEKKTLDLLGSEGRMIQPVLISLDPGRDTPQVLSSYVETEVFPEGLVGLTGTQEAVSEAAKGFRVGWQRAEDAGSAAHYTIDHTSYFYLMDENWQLKALFPSSFAPEEAAQCIKAGLRTAKKR